MKILSVILSALLIASISGSVYLYQAVTKPMQNELESKHSELENLNLKASNLEKELNQKVAELAHTQKEKEAEISRVQSTKDSLIAEMQNEIQDSQIKITQLADKLQVSIVDKILFASGEAEIAPAGLAVLKRVGDLLKSQNDKIIRVEGHTDNIPIQSKKNIFPTNWELSTARAITVVRFLQEEVHIQPERLEAVGMGEHHPLSSNDTKEGRAKNRRIEIALLPVK